LHRPSLFFSVSQAARATTAAMEMAMEMAMEEEMHLIL
jgi:hypothetical protein